MKRAVMGVGLLALAAAGCAALRGERGPSPTDRLQQGLAALAARDFAAARPVLEGLYLAEWRQPAGRQALLALAAAELDSRNPERRLGVGADLAGRYLSLAGVPGWSVPAAESLHLLAVELGAREEELARAAAEQAAEVSLLKSEFERERGELGRRVAQLEQRLAAREAELKDAAEELERIRRTLKR